MDASPTYSSEIPSYLEKKYNIQRRIGYGSYGTVFLAEQKSTHKQVAVKFMDNIFSSREDAVRTLREISVLRQCHHPNICKVIDAFIPKDKDSFNSVWIVLEYGGWDLQKVMDTYRNIAGWSQAHVKYILYQILCAFNYLNSANIIHRDMKPSNILMDQHCGIHIIDFGLARRIVPETAPQINKQGMIVSPHTMRSGSSGDIDTDNVKIPVTSKFERQMTSHVTTRWYRSPEILVLEKKYSFSVDIWSIGCIFSELLQTLEPTIAKPMPLFPGKSCYPFSSGTRQKDIQKFKEEFEKKSHQLEKVFEVIGTPSEDDVSFISDEDIKKFLLELKPIKRTDFKARYPHSDQTAIDLLNQMLQFNPNKRVTPMEALQSPYFDGMRRADLEVDTKFEGSLVLPYDFTDLDSDSSMKMCRHLIYNEVHQLRDAREEEEEKISFVRRLSSSSKVYQSLITKQQPNKIFEDEEEEGKKKCSIM